MSTRPHLSNRGAAIVRLVHQAGRATLEDLLTRYQAQALSAAALRRMLDWLERMGWVTKLRDPRHKRSNGVAWAVTEEALPHLWESAPLPQRPTALPRPARIARPSAPARRTEPPGERVPPRRARDWTPWVPPPAPLLRAGSQDFLRCKSKGAFP